MKKFGLLCISLLFIFSSAMAQRSTISRFGGEDIKGLMVDGAFKVKIVKSNTTGAEVDITDKMAEKLVFELTEEGYVRIAYGSTVGNVFISKDDIPQVIVTMPTLEKLTLKGKITLLSSGEFTAENFEYSASERATAEFVKVKCQNARIKCYDASNTEGLVINAENEVKINTLLTSSLQIKGSAPKVIVKTEDASKVDMLLFETPMIDVSTSGTSLVKANVSKKAVYYKKGLSSFKYVGDGFITGDKASKL